jgi:BirA family biotin operon repressor/biotin-[acetyl-CoA-carboxylase] ligase
VFQVLDEMEIPELSIKWPNDIMSDTKKIGGILIENSIKSDGAILSIVGLGLNVNQTNFEDLPKASSLAVVCERIFDKEEILFSIVENIKKNVRMWYFI